ncbi:MAG: SDR family oxidoreductase [Candidatus Thiodiazotropha sp. (ex Rostrolucina anterorostrata)]|nr:SDR family oxidoreductase [Candidatus Thiodiazotropha sp. (ex Rostrolucina anterorostrata)]
MGVTIVGCGDIGRRIAKESLSEGDVVTGWVRSEESIKYLQGLGIGAMQIDLDQPLATIPPVENERLFYLAPPPSVGCEDSRVANLIDHLLDGGQPKKVVYLSTSGVYGDCNGAWVDETRRPAPAVDRARRRLDAERRWQTWCEHTGGELVILRVAGIYGPGKLPVQRLQQGQPMVSEADSPFTNHIHSLDLVKVCLAAMQRGHSGEVFNVCDGHPNSMTSYFNQVADFLHLPRLPQISLDQAKHTLSPGMLSYLGESRRLSNHKLLDELSVALSYSTLEQGLPACL